MLPLGDNKRHIICTLRNEEPAGGVDPGEWTAENYAPRRRNDLEWSQSRTSLLRYKRGIVRNLYLLERAKPRDEDREEPKERYNHSFNTIHLVRLRPSLRNRRPNHLTCSVYWIWKQLFFPIFFVLLTMTISSSDIKCVLLHGIFHDYTLNILYFKKYSMSSNLWYFL